MPLQIQNTEKFRVYLEEIQQKCGSYKNTISEDEYKKLLSYVDEARQILKENASDSKTVICDKDKTSIIENCCEIILIFTKYIIANKDQSRNQRLKNASLVREGLLSSETNVNRLREFKHVLSLLKNIYFERIDDFIGKFKLNNAHEIINLDSQRNRLYQAGNSNECQVILNELLHDYSDSISDKRDELVKIIKSYGSILDKHNETSKPNVSVNAVQKDQPTVSPAPLAKPIQETGTKLKDQFYHKKAIIPQIIRATTEKDAYDKPARPLPSISKEFSKKKVVLESKFFERKNLDSITNKKSSNTVSETVSVHSLIKKFNNM